MTSETTDRARTRRGLAAASLFLPLLAVILTWLLWREELPAEVASHWSDLGAADGALPTTAVLIAAIVVTGLAASAGVVVACMPRLRPATARGVFFFAGFFAGMAVGVWVIPAALTIQAGSATEAVLGGWILALFALIAYALVPYAIAPKQVLERSSIRKRIDLEPTEMGAWSKTITGTIFVWVTIGMAVLGVVVYLLGGQGSESWFGMIIFALVVVVSASFIRLRISIDWRGLRIVSSLFHIPLKRIRLEQIDTVEAAELRPQDWGGWGYRVMPGRSALILHKGPGLIVSTTRGKLFAVSLNEPEEPAALLATLRDGSLPEEEASPVPDQHAEDSTRNR